MEYIRLSERGFTLLELLIVIVLATLILGLSIPFIGGSLPSARLAAAGREISATIRQSSALAQNKGEDLVLTVDLDTRKYGVDEGRMKAISSEILIRIEDPDGGEIRTGKYPIVLRATGGVEGGRIALGYKKKVLYIDVDPVVGAVTVRE
jgi:general secretion pathway protein H